MNENNERVLNGRMCMEEGSRADLSDYLASISEQVRHMRKHLEDGACVSELLDQSASARAALSTFADTIGKAESTSCGAACLNSAARTRLQRVATALRSLQK